MPRVARLVIPDVPHHVTQRGNRRQTTFFSDGDYRLYKSLLAEWCAKTGTKIWAWCLMPNHVHLVLVPSHSDGLRAALGETHRRYTRHVNEREGWRGHLWQERFASFPMDEPHCLSALRYVELNPVRARLVNRPEDWAWSSARAHLRGAADGVTDLAGGQAMVSDWRAFLAEGLQGDAHEAIRAGERNGRPLGSTAFRSDIERLTGSDLTLRPRGRPTALK
jgi:putative transposase